MRLRILIKIHSLSAITACTVLTGVVSGRRFILSVVSQCYNNFLTSELYNFMTS